jgi:hypothetical protein
MSEKKIHHMWVGDGTSVCGMTVADADPTKHHFEEDWDCANCKKCIEQLKADYKYEKLKL